MIDRLTQNKKKKIFFAAQNNIKLWKCFCVIRKTMRSALRLFKNALKVVLCNACNVGTRCKYYP